ncbi:MAG: hypothetical protein E6K19_01580 [Methanobacteriota archaeon]|nr:MAG: hypothetical protein E6K19_01580 [Euryarchaeota archaeon]
MATVTEAWNERGYETELPLRMRRFVWLSTGMFSAASLALAFVGYFFAGSFEGAGSHFLASMVSGGMFGIASVLKFGVDEA